MYFCLLIRPSVFLFVRLLVSQLGTQSLFLLLLLLLLLLFVLLLLVMLLVLLLSLLLLLLLSLLLYLLLLLLSLYAMVVAGEVLLCMEACQGAVYFHSPHALVVVVVVAAAAVVVVPVPVPVAALSCYKRTSPVFFSTAAAEFVFVDTHSSCCSCCSSCSC